MKKGRFVSLSTLVILELATMSTAIVFYEAMVSWGASKIVAALVSSFVSAFAWYIVAAIVLDLIKLLRQK